MNDLAIKHNILQNPGFVGRQIPARNLYSVTFFNGVNICTSKSIQFETGYYEHSVLGLHFSAHSKNRPVIAKINKLTCMVIYSQPNRGGETRTYNNPYSDRYVVVQLPVEFEIKSLDIRPYTVHATEEHFVVTGEGIFLSTFDIVVILGIVLLVSCDPLIVLVIALVIWLYYQHKL
jgi:hypothetical protein